MNFINGTFQDASTGQFISVNNPCNGDVVGQCARSNAEDVNLALQSARSAFLQWKKEPLAKRIALQHRAAELMRQHAEELGKTLALELGRPFVACKHEITRSAELLDFYAEEALRVKGELPLHNIEGEKAMVVREPVGVVVAITPFNYPITLLVFKLGAALVMGCTVVAKPSEETPLSTLRLAELFIEAGYPPGVFNVINGYGHEIGDALVQHPLTSKVAFTGGTNTGRHIASLAAAQFKRITLELGGQSPAILCADTDLDVAIPALVKHAFANSGQFCYRVNRVYVHHSLYPDFLEKLKSKVEKLEVGADPFRNPDMGPLINEKIFRNSENQVADAVAKGARLLTGGQRLGTDVYAQGWFFPPTVLADTTHDMKIMSEETFGPVLGVMPFDQNAEAIQWANASDYGLAAYVFSAQLGTGLRLAEQLEAGSVWVNNIHRSNQDAPFGGMKASGMGREKGHQGLEAYTELKTIYLSY
jgi:succinate-semialdehyde dehydrogenase/glutarate-semialdehyde dehydrogenase